MSRRRAKSRSHQVKKANVSRRRASRRMNVQTRLAVLNLIVTLVITLVVGIWVPIYINVSNQQFQNDMLITLAKIEQQNELAHLEVHSLCSQDSSCLKYQVINLGPGTAKNIRTIIILSSQQGFWNSFIKNMDQFTISTTPSSLPILVSPMYSSNSLDSQGEPTDNAKEILLDTLPAGEAFQFDIEPNNMLEKSWMALNVKEKQTTRYLFAVDGHNITASEVSTITFDINSQCDNCTGTDRQLDVIYNPLLSLIDATTTKSVAQFVQWILRQDLYHAYKLAIEMFSPGALDVPNFLSSVYSLIASCWMADKLLVDQPASQTYIINFELTNVACVGYRPLGHYDWALLLDTQEQKPSLLSTDLYSTDPTISKESLLAPFLPLYNSLKSSTTDATLKKSLLAPLLPGIVQQIHQYL